jgi:predicted nuclease with TOPRIM domain
VSGQIIMNSENSTFEMETRENFDKILHAINGLRQDFVQRSDKIETEQRNINQKLDKIETEQTKLRPDFDEFKHFVEVQFEAVRQGIVRNYNQFDRVKSQIAENRSVIFSTKALVGELNEKVYLLSRSTEQIHK